MKLVTEYRGEIEYSEDDIITIEDGMYGFSESKHFIMIANVEPELPFHWMQSVDDKELVFVVVDPFLFVEKYDFNIDDLSIEQLKLEKIEDLMVYTTVIIPEDVQNITINLKSPVIININERRAKQIILDGDFEYKHQIFAKGDV